MGRVALNLHGGDRGDTVVTVVWREEVHLFAEMNSKDMYFRNIGAVTMPDIFFLCIAAFLLLFLSSPY